MPFPQTIHRSVLAQAILPLTSALKSLTNPGNSYDKRVGDAARMSLGRTWVNISCWGKKSDGCCILGLSMLVTQKLQCRLAMPSSEYSSGGGNLRKQHPRCWPSFKTNPFPLPFPTAQNLLAREAPLVDCNGVFTKGKLKSFVF